MKKNLIVLLIIVLGFSSCEKDDICVDDTTPNLIIRFYDKNDTNTTKQVANLTVWANEKDSLYVNQSLDSISIPLNISANSTTYKFASDNLIDEITFSYQTKDIFVSRSCGYKSNFENVAISSNTNNWISSITINNATVSNEKNAHIYIYH